MPSPKNRTLKKQPAAVLTLSDDLLQKTLPPGQFKFTSKQGRARRMQLLNAAKELLQERAAEDVSLADVCERAGIPRASAYHFFSNIQAVFLGLRVLHAEALIEALGDVHGADFDHWRDYFAALIDKGAQALLRDAAATRLIYGNLGSMAEARRLGEVLDARLAEIALQGLTQRFQLPQWEQQDQVFAVAFTLVDSVFRLSWRQRATITDWMIEEAKRAAISYLRNYLPELLPLN
jgi:AcrR family transcriptional regulator